MFNLIIFLLFLNILSVFSNQQFFVRKSELYDKPSKTILIDTNLGSIIGYEKDILNKTNSINVFYGVPYGEPPIGKLRFKKTKLIRKFNTQPYEALYFKPHCVQEKSKKYNKDDKFDEDCLYLNIFTPNLNLIRKDNACTKKFDTIAYFYGGKSSIYQLSPLLDANNNSHLSYSADLFPALNDVIFVTINFRQDLLANLYLEGKFPGNLALFDQNLALNWIKKNIRSFCGNGDITVAGNSFGGNSLGVHLISRYSRNLIKNAIIQSASPLFQELSPVKKSEMIINSFLAIKKLGCMDLDSKRLIRHIKHLDNNIKLKYFELIEQENFLKQKYFFTELGTAFNKLDKKLKNKQNPFKSDDLIDKDLLKLVEFLSKYAVNIDCLRNVKTEQIINLDAIHNSLEFQIWYDFDFIETESYLDYKLFNKLNFNPNLNLLIGGVSDEQCSLGVILKEIYYSDKYNPPAIKKSEAKKLIESFNILIIDKPEISKLMAEYYTDETKWNLNKGYYEALTNLGQDYQFDCPAHFYASYGSKTANSVSAFRITQIPSKHFGSGIYDLDNSWSGPCHADELNFLFGLPFRVPNQFTNLDRDFSLKLINLFSYFAKNGKMPKLTNGQQWPSSNRKNQKLNYVEINQKFLREKKFEHEERCDNFWKPILPFYKR